MIGSSSWLPLLLSVICQGSVSCESLKGWPYSVMVVGIDQLKKLAFKHLQRRLEGDG